jgi:hypothetical protein
VVICYLTARGEHYLVPNRKSFVNLSNMFVYHKLGLKMSRLRAFSESIMSR